MRDANYVPQVGGDHYEREGARIQHWDLMEKFDVDYLSACASKYVLRCRKKGTIMEDLEKALSYYQKLLVTRDGDVRRTIPAEALDNFFMANKVDEDLASIVRDALMSRPRRRGDIEMAMLGIRKLLKEEDQP